MRADSAAIAPENQLGDCCGPSRTAACAASCELLQARLLRQRSKPMTAAAAARAAAAASSWPSCVDGRLGPPGPRTRQLRAATRADGAAAVRQLDDGCGGACWPTAALLRGPPLAPASAISCPSHESFEPARTGDKRTPPASSSAPRSSIVPRRASSRRSGPPSWRRAGPGRTKCLSASARTTTRSSTRHRQGNDRARQLSTSSPTTTSLTSPTSERTPRTTRHVRLEALRHRRPRAPRWVLAPAARKRRARSQVLPSSSTRTPCRHVRLHALRRWRPHTSA